MEMTVIISLKLKPFYDLEQLDSSLFFNTFLTIKLFQTDTHSFYADRREFASPRRDRRVKSESISAESTINWWKR